MKRSVVLVFVLLILAGAALDLMRQRGWISERPTWAILGISAALGVLLGRLLKNRQERT